MGMEASIIPLTWPEEHHPAERFETEARKLRYQALGQACKEKRIKLLMLGHHADDQAETIMMRLMNMRLRSGLRGMQGVEWIPECYGMYGAYHSGGLHAENTKAPDVPNLPYPVEKGGIQIVRPLLGFEKSRLIATCEEHGTAWAEDKTNQNRTLTSRNAIRHIFKNHQLPAALTIKSLMKVSQRMQARLESHKREAYKLIDNCPMKLDIQTGALIVRFPPTEALLGHPIVTDSDKYHARNTAYFLLERFAELVTPRERAPRSQLANAVLQIYPSLLSEDETELGIDPTRSGISKNNFCVFGVWWRPWSQPSPFDGLTSQPHSQDWLLSRQPLDPHEKDSPEANIAFPPTGGPLSLTNTPAGGDWHLFDGRFWIRVDNRTKCEIILRTLNDSELHVLAHNKPPGRKFTVQEISLVASSRYHRAALALINPTELRRHLPALFLKADSGEEILLALPTLGSRSTNLDPSLLPRACSWEVRYKKCNFGRRSVEDIVVPGIRNVHIEAEEQRYRREAGGIKRLKLRTDALAGDEGMRDAFPGFKNAEKEVRLTREGRPRREKKRGPLEMSESEREGLATFLEEDLQIRKRESYKLFEEPKKEGSRRISWADFESRV